jgi:hypothetical protein
MIEMMRGSSLAPRERAMHCELYALCAPRRLELTEGLVEALQSSQASSYRDLDGAELRSRAARLVEAFLASLAEQPTRFVHHVESIVADRMASGFALQEVQRALTLLEERIWGLVVAECPANEHAPCLARATATIGCAKDRLAQLYFSELQRQLTRVQQCERRLEALFRGTAEAPAVDEG